MKQINLKQVNWMKALKIAGGGVAAILRMLEEAERERQRQKILRRSRDEAR